MRKEAVATCPLTKAQFLRHWLAGTKAGVKRALPPIRRHVISRARPEWSLTGSTTSTGPGQPPRRAKPTLARRARRPVKRPTKLSSQRDGEGQHDPRPRGRPR